MNAGLLITFSALLFAWSVVSARVERLDVTGPMVFVVAGLVLCNGPLAVLHLSVETVGVHELAEITLGLLLFADASRVNPQDLRARSGLPIRLLAIGLPMTIAAGFGLAAALFTDLPWELAALLGAVLAPTDAALSAAVVSDESLPEDLRRTLNVESGLNDGIATPVVTTLIAAAGVIIGTGALEEPGSNSAIAALEDLAGGALVGIVVGYLGGIILQRAQAKGWIEPGGRRVAILMLAILAFAASREAGVNYFVAAFVAGLAFRAAIGVDDPEATELPELAGRILALVVWFIFGGALLLDGLEGVDWRVALYAALSLTLVRMVPVAISLIGSKEGRRTTLFIGWFGPRGLATVIFGLLIVEELPVGDPGVQLILSTIVLTIVLSVAAHGASGRPLTAWMARHGSVLGVQPTPGSSAP